MKSNRNHMIDLIVMVNPFKIDCECIDDDCTTGDHPARWFAAVSCGCLYTICHLPGRRDHPLEAKFECFRCDNPDSEVLQYLPVASY
jgi:hypothetical protein